MKTEILYEDEVVLVVHKKAGMATQSARDFEMDVESELKNYLKGSELHVIHRLDQVVEGILVFAKTGAAAADLSAQLTGDRMEKIYTARCLGKLEEPSGTLIDYLVKLPNGMAKVSSGKGGRMAKKCILHYETVDYDAPNDVSTLRIRLETGRFHQIRVQLAHAGHPLIGDRKYGSAEANQKAIQMGLRFVALCASELSFDHPGTGERMSFSLED